MSKQFNEATKIVEFGDTHANSLIRTLDTIVEDETLLPEKLREELYDHIDKLDEVRTSIKRVHGSKQQHSNNHYNSCDSSKSQIEILFDRIKNGDLLEPYDTAEEFKRLEKSERLIHRLMWSFANASQSSYELFFHRSTGTKRKAVELKESGGLDEEMK